MILSIERFFLSVSFFLVFASTPKLCAQENAEALLIVYPDYPINTDSFYGYTELVGHAGVLLIAEDGLTKYYEFGRYDDDKQGQVIRRRIPNAKIRNGTAALESLQLILQELSDSAGKGGRIRAAYFVNMNFNAMNDLAESMVGASDPKDPLFDKKRKAYSIGNYNCGHFAEEIILKGNAKVDRPSVINPTPNNFADEYIEEKNAEVLFDPKTRMIVIGHGDESDAKTK